ncbi:hypothetical protein [Mycolicibacter heraklionensis]|uniref:hypothetical protein n=1 Tax=Mycolicibacter heraklionensis TaxID=512402 RepID=UPI0007E9CF15|nr:hypothetical protein [Mycolicibacter heraklionensis]OBG41236.1 hypothetical protein A5671_13150 [Mycolicibacter heraklionensis]
MSELFWMLLPTSTTDDAGELMPDFGNTLRLAATVDEGVDYVIEPCRSPDFIDQVVTLSLRTRYGAVVDEIGRYLSYDAAHAVAQCHFDEHGAQ